MKDVTTSVVYTGGFVYDDVGCSLVDDWEDTVLLEWDDSGVCDEEEVFEFCSWEEWLEAEVVG